MSPSSILAATATPPFFAEVAALLMASAVVAYLCHRLGVTPIVSFLVTGALIGPHALGLVRDEALIEAAAEIGVVLLLFTVGIEFSLANLVRIKRLIWIGGGVQVGVVIGVVSGLLALAGVDWRAALLTGCLVALSSTAIVMKLLLDRGETDSEVGSGTLGMLIFQDLAVVAMVLVVPMLGGTGGSAAGVAWALGKAGALIALVLVVARRVMPKVLEAVARTCSQEIFVLTVMAICFGTAYLTSLAGVSLSLGAFLAGLVVSESRFSELAFGEIQPLQILFSATFFVSVGLLLDLHFLVSHLPLVLAVVAAVVVIKVASAALAVRLLGYGAGTALFSALLIAQVGEFSFVLERSAGELGLFPAGVADGGPQTFIAATVILMMGTPLLARLGGALERRLAVRADGSGLGVDADAAPTDVDEADAAHADLDGHIIIAGYGQGGRELARVLDERGVPHLIVTLSPDGASEAERQGLRVLRGNYARRHELLLAGVRRARLLVVADDDREMTRRVVRSVRALDAAPPILVRTRFDHEASALLDTGVEHVVSEEREGIVRLVETVLGLFDVPEEARRAATEKLRAAPLVSRPSPGGGTTLRLSDSQLRNASCSHAAAIGEVTPGSAGCEECLALGDSWVHLRLCMTCGHVGCCDSSKNRHATKHFHTTGHPVVRSFQPGESWAWCYADEVML